MAQAVSVQEGHAVDYTPGAAVNAGDVVVQGELVGVARTPLTAGAVGTLAVDGVFDFAKATGAGTAITVGANVYWDNTAKVATLTATGNKLIGKCVKAAADTAATVRVRLNQ
jgi:predicted RecA/RadA family phage recombinase